MAPTIVNATVTPISGQEVGVATLAGGAFDNIDAYVTGGQWNDGSLIFRIYAINGAVRNKVAEAPYSGPNATLLKWAQGNPIQAQGTSYALVVFAKPNQGSAAMRGMPVTPSSPDPITATIAGVNDGDTAANTSTSASPVLPSDGSEVTVGTANGWSEVFSAACNVSGLPNVRLNLYASSGGGSVSALIASQESGADSSETLLFNAPLSVATLYTLKVQKTIADGVSGQTCPTSLTTSSSAAGGGGGGAVPLSPEVSGPSNNNVVTGPFSQASLFWKNTVLAAAIGTNVAGGTFTALFDLGLAAVTFDPGTKKDTFFDSDGVTPMARLGTVGGSQRALHLGIGAAYTNGNYVVNSDAATFSTFNVPNGGTGVISFNNVTNVVLFTISRWTWQTIALFEGQRSTAGVDAGTATDQQVWFTGTGTYQLPNPATHIGTSLEIIIGYAAGAGSGVTILPAGAETINGVAAPLVWITPFVTLKVRSNGVNWVIS